MIVCLSDDHHPNDCCADSHNETSYTLTKTHDWFMDLSIRPAEITAIFTHFSFTEESWGRSVSRSCDSKLKAASHQSVAVGTSSNERPRSSSTCTISRQACWTEKLHMELWAYLLYNSKNRDGNQPSIWTSSREACWHLCQKLKNKQTLLPCFEQNWHV